jgi:chromate transport protein ChrA
MTVGPGVGMAVQTLAVAVNVRVGLCHRLKLAQQPACTMHNRMSTGHRGSSTYAAAMPQPHALAEPSLAEIAREWGRIGCIGFGGPPAHVALFRALCVTQREWLTDEQFERVIAATNLLPGPASTQLAIYCAWRLRGPQGALIGGLGFILPGLVLILALSALFLSGSPPVWIRGAGMGAGAAVAPVAVRAGLGVALPIWRRAAHERSRVLAYALAGGIGTDHADRRGCRHRWCRRWAARRAAAALGWAPEMRHHDERWPPVRI